MTPKRPFKYFPKRDPLEDILDQMVLDSIADGSFMIGEIVGPKGDPRQSILAGDWCGNSPTQTPTRSNARTEPDWIESLSSDRYTVQS